MLWRFINNHAHAHFYDIGEGATGFEVLCWAYLQVKNIKPLQICVLAGRSFGQAISLPRTWWWRTLTKLLPPRDRCLTFRTEYLRTLLPWYQVVL